MKIGLTLIEIIIVLAVIALLATMVIGIASHIDTQSKEKAIEATFALLEGALDEYKDVNDNFPVQIEVDSNNAPAHSELLYEALDFVPASRNIMKKISDKLIQNKYNPVADPPVYEIYDPWGTALDYIYDTSRDTYPLLISAGKDKTFGNGDDIRNR